MNSTILPNSGLLIIAIFELYRTLIAMYLSPKPANISMYADPVGFLEAESVQGGL